MLDVLDGVALQTIEFRDIVWMSTSARCKTRPGERDHSTYDHSDDECEQDFPHSPLALGNQGCLRRSEHGNHRQIAHFLDLRLVSGSGKRRIKRLFHIDGARQAAILEREGG